MSGDDLDGSFVLAPSREQDLFSKRDKYDIVVYYDQSMSDNKFLSGPTQGEHQVALRSLHLAIYDYAYGKRLQRPPMLLLGGLNAWINLAGKFSLKSTDPAETPRPEIISRPESRVGRHSKSLEKPRSGIGVTRDASPNRAESSNRSSIVRRRQERDSQRGSMPPPIQRASYSRKSEPTPVDPINIEEEKKWMERLQREREPLTISVPPVSPMADGEADIKRRRRGTSIVAGSDSPSYARTVEEFVSLFSLTLCFRLRFFSPRLTSYSFFSSFLIFPSCISFLYLFSLLLLTNITSFLSHII
jgi:ubiquitin carboxyl-terminal hydrolase 8